MSVRKAKIKPLGNRALVKRLPYETRRGVIWLGVSKDSPSVQFSPKPAVVVAVGPGVLDETTGLHHKPSIVEGDVVNMGVYPGDAVPEVGVNEETGELVDILGSTRSDLFIVKISSLVCGFEK